MSNRLEKAFSALDENDVDAILITSPENHLYISGVDNPDGSLLITGDAAYIFADFRYSEAVKRECLGFELIVPDGRVTDYLPELVKKHDIRTLGYEDGSMTCKAFSAVAEKLPDCGFKRVSASLEEARRVKTPDETEKIIKAQRIAEAAFEQVLGKLSKNMTEADVAAELEYAMRRFGADDRSFVTIAVSGKASSGPHGVSRGVRLEKGFLTMDFGAICEGYHSDMTRTVVLGRADEEMRRLYETVLTAQKAALSAIAENESNYEIDKTARDIISEAGYSEAFGHALGHGVGLKIHEKPNMSPYTPKDERLRAGEVVTVEPGIYLEGKYGCRIEDMVVVTESGCENLTKTPKSLIEIDL